jgi:flagellar biosynthesis chaperone FliJ
MHVSRPLRRLLRVLHLEEEETRRRLESALGDLRRLENSLEAAGVRDRSGRRMVNLSAQSGELADRIAGMEESLAAARRTAALKPWIRDAEQEVSARREVFLSKRIERRQAETLVDAAQARDTLEDARRTQRSLDEWHLNRLHRAATEADTGSSQSSDPETKEP